MVWKMEQYRFGAFKNYYFFNPVQERLKLITEEALTFCELNYKDKNVAIKMCDLGCNSGDLTISLYDKFSKN